MEGAFLVTDGWSNILTGLGRAERDKRLSSSFGTPRLLTETQLDRLYAGDWRIARIVDRPASDQVRRWWDIAIDGRRDQADLLHARLREIGAKAAFRDGIGSSRLHGTALGIMIVDDGQPMDHPVALNRLRRVESLRVVDRWEVTVDRYNTDAGSDAHGLPELYRLSSRLVDPRGEPLAPLIHASRVLRWDGVRTSRRRILELGGWSDSVVTRVYDVVRDWAQAIGGAAHLSTDFAQAVLKIKNLSKLLAENHDQTVLKRLQVLDMARSLVRMVPLDDGEEFERKQTPVTGLPELLDRLRDELVGAADIPEKILFGKATAGLGDQGQSDLEQYYNMIEGEQERNVLPQSTQLVSYLLAEQNQSPSSWEVVARPLWTPSETEVSENRLKDAQADDLRVRNSILTPDEIRQSRFGGDGYRSDLQVEPPDDDDDDDPEGSVDLDPSVALAMGGAGGLTLEQLTAATSLIAQATEGKLPLASVRVLLERGLGLSPEDVEALVSGVEQEREERARKAEAIQQQPLSGGSAPGAPVPGDDPQAEDERGEEDNEASDL